MIKIPKLFDENAKKILKQIFIDSENEKEEYLTEDERILKEATKEVEKMEIKLGSGKNKRPFKEVVDSKNISKILNKTKSIEKEEKDIDLMR